MRTKQQRRIRIFILGLGTVIFLAFLGLDPLMRTITKRDRLAATPHSGVASIVQLFPPHLDENGRPFPSQVLLRFQGRIALTNSVYGLSELKEGGQARLTYRIGRTGRLYIDRVEPMQAR